MCCGGLLGVANPAFLGWFLCSGLLSVAPYCAPGGIRVVSGRATATVRRQVQWHALASFGATIRRPPFLGVAAGCRIALDKPISLLAVPAVSACCALSSVKGYQLSPLSR